MSVVSPQLLSRLLKQHGAALVLYARQWCQTPEDVVQEAFVRLMAEKESPENAAAWLYRVVRNGALNASRSAARRGQHESVSARCLEPWFEDVGHQHLDAREAADALQLLPGPQRETIVARLWGGLSFEQIGELTDSSTSTAYRRYQAGIQSLRERLGVLCPENQDHRPT